MADRERNGGSFLEADWSSVITRSRVRRGFRICCLCIDAPGFIDARVDERFANGARLGDGCLGPPSFRQSEVVNSGRRAP